MKTDICQYEIIDEWATNFTGDAKYVPANCAQVKIVITKMEFANPSIGTDM